MIKNYNIRVIGKVQGVWFRKYTKEAALGFHLKGSVRNDSDGSVFIEAEGKESDLKLFIEWLHNGSPLSRVEKVSWKEGSVQGLGDFGISR